MYNLAKEKLGGEHYFIEDGATYDDGGTTFTLDASTRPATLIDEMGNLGCVIDVQFDKDEQEDETTCFCPESKSYKKETDYFTIADYIDLQIRDHSEPIYRMLFGIDGAIPTDGSEVALYQSGERSITGWVLIKGSSATTKTEKVTKWLRVKMILKEYPGWSNEITLPTLRYQVLSSTLNTGVFATDL